MAFISYIPVVSLLYKCVHIKYDIKVALCMYNVQMDIGCCFTILLKGCHLLTSTGFFFIKVSDHKTEIRFISTSVARFLGLMTDSLRWLSVSSDLGTDPSLISLPHPSSVRLTMKHYFLCQVLSSH